MSLKTSIDISNTMREVIENELRKEFEKEFDLLVEDFNRKKGEILAGILVSIMEKVDMQIMEDRLIFEIKNPKTPKNN